MSLSLLTELCGGILVLHRSICVVTGSLMTWLSLDLHLSHLCLRLSLSLRLGLGLGLSLRLRLHLMGLHLCMCLCLLRAPWPRRLGSQPL